MKTIRFIHLIIIQILLSSFISLGQNDIINVELFPIENIESYRSSARPVYEILFTDKLYYKKKQYKIRLPENNSEYGIAFIYYTGNIDNIIPRTIPVLIEDYKSNNPRFYLDENNNLDFTDDGSPKRYEQNSLKRNGISYRYVDFVFGNEQKIRNPYKFYLLEKADTTGLNHLKNSIRTGKNEKLADVEYWLSEIRFNKVAANLQIRNNSFQIILEDSYCNSLYGEVGEFVIINEFTEQNKNQDKWRIKQETIISLNDNSFILKEIDPLGRSVIIEKTKRHSKVKLHTGDTIKDFQLKLINGEETFLKKYLHQEKYILLYFWGTWCAPCKQRLPLLKEMYKNYNNRIEIIGLANDRKLSKVKNYIKKNEIKWVNTRTENDILVKLNIIGYPSFVLLNENGVIVKEHSNIKEIEDIIKLYRNE
jgi:thiol-disulfide isomerase/thioredoxin